MIVISDSTVLINFAVLNLFHILRTFFRVLLVPTAVYKEVYANGNYKPGSQEILKARKEGWIQVCEVNKCKFYSNSKISHLHKGEREAIALAYDIGDGFLLTDDKAAIEICKKILSFRGINYLTSYDVCELMYRKKVIKMTALEMRLKLNQLNRYK